MRDGDFVEGVRALLVDKVSITNVNDYERNDACCVLCYHYNIECIFLRMYHHLSRSIYSTVSIYIINAESFYSAVNLYN